MNTELAPYIEKLLYSNDTVVIPGFGAFVAMPSPAAIDYAGGSVAPPSKSLSFNENLTTDDGLLTYAIVNERGISDEEARIWVDEKVMEMQALLSQREIVALPGIGRLYKNYVQKVQFLPDAANFSRDHFGLPPLQFSPLSRSREVTEILTAPLNGTTNEPSYNTTQAPASVPVFEPDRSGGLSPARILLAVALLAISGAGGYYFLKSRSHQAKTDIPATESPSQKPAPEETAGVTPTPVPEPPVVQEKPVTPPPTATTTKPTPAPAVNERECIALIGMFKDEANIARLKKLLSSNGFSVYSVATKSGAQSIGAQFKYAGAADMEQKLAQVRKLTGEKNLVIKKK